MVRRKLIEQLKSNTEETREKIIKALLNKFRQNHNLFEDIVNIYINFDLYRDLIIKEFKNLTSDDMKNGSNINLLVSLYTEDLKRIEELLSYLKSQQIFGAKQQEVFDKIKNMRK